MIVFDLVCAIGHRFEGWFGSSADFDAQLERGLLSCPTCGMAGVRRVPSATRYNAGAAEEPKRAPLPEAQPQDRDPLALAQILYARLVDEILVKSEDVGPAFAEEARRIFRDEAPARAIRGEATEEQHAELLDEGIPVLRIPVPRKDRYS